MTSGNLLFPLDSESVLYAPPAHKSISRVNLESYVHFMEYYVHSMRIARAKSLEITKGLLKIFKECIGNARYIPKLFWLVAPLLLLELINKKHHVLWN